MQRAAVGLLGAWLIVAGGKWAGAQTSLIPPPPGHVKVTVEFRQVSQSTQGGSTTQGTGPGGTVIEVDPKGVTGSARVQIQESQRTVRRSVGSFLLVQDGGEGRLTILPNKRIRLKITPQISYRSDDGSGTIELVEATTEVVVQSGQPITLGGSGGSGEVARQFLLGYERVNRTSQASIVLTAETP